MADDLKTMMDEMALFGPSVKTHPAFWGREQLDKLEKYKKLHPEEYELNKGIQAAEFRYRSIKQAREENKLPGRVMAPPDAQGPLGKLRSILPAAVGGGIDGFRDLSAAELEQQGLIPKKADLPEGWKQEVLVEEANDLRWKAAAEAAMKEGRSVERLLETQGEADERAGIRRNEVGGASAMGIAKGALPAGETLLKATASSKPAMLSALAGGFPVNIDSSQIAETPPEEIDNIAKKSPIASSVGGLLGGLLNPLQLFKGNGAGPKAGTGGGVGIASGVARGMGVGAGNALIGGQIDETGEAIRRAFQDKRDVGVGERAKEYLNESFGNAPGRALLGGTLGGILGGLSGFSKGLRNQYNDETRPLRDFEAMGGTTSVSEPGGLKPTREMRIYQDLARPNQGKPSAQAAADFAPVTAELAHGRARSVAESQDATNRAFYEASDTRGDTANAGDLSTQAINKIRDNRYSLNAVEDDLYLHDNHPLRQLVKKTTDPIQVLDGSPPPPGEKMTVDEAVSLGLLKPTDTVHVPGKGQVPVSALGMQAQRAEAPSTAMVADDMATNVEASGVVNPNKGMAPVEIVFMPREVTAREMDQIVGGWHEAKNSDAAGRGGAAHPMFDELYPAIKEMRGQFGGKSPITMADEYEVIPGGGGETTRTSGWNRTKDQQYQEMSALEGDLRRVGIQSKSFDPKNDTRVHDSVRAALQGYGDDPEAAKSLDRLYLGAGQDLKPLETIRGLKLLEGPLGPEGPGKSTSMSGAAMKAIQAQKYRIDPVARAISSRLGGLTGFGAPAASDPLTDALIELKRKEGWH